MIKYHKYLLNVPHWGLWRLLGQVFFPVRERVGLLCFNSEWKSFLFYMLIFVIFFCCCCAWCRSRGARDEYLSPARSRSISHSRSPRDRRDYSRSPTPKDNGRSPREVDNARSRSRSPKGDSRSPSGSRSRSYRYFAFYAPLHFKFPFLISAFLSKRIYTGKCVSYVLVLVVSEFMVIL